MAFKMRSGNRTTFKDMGSSPNKQQMDNTQIGTTLTTYTHDPTQVNVPPTDPIQDSGSAPVSTGAPGGSSAPDSLKFGNVTPPPPGDINYPDSSEENKKKTLYFILSVVGNLKSKQKSMINMKYIECWSLEL